MLDRKKIRAGKGFDNLEGSIEGKRWKIYRVFNRGLPPSPNFPPKVVSQMRLRGWAGISTGSNLALASGRLSPQTDVDRR